VSLPGINKLSGRLLWVTATLFGVLLAMTFYAHTLVRNNADESVELTRNNNQLSASVYVIKEILQQVDSQVYQYASLLDKTLHEQILFNIASVKNQTKSLSQHPSVLADKDSKKFSFELIEEIHELERNIEDYVLVMQSVESRYPGMPILMDFMEPINRRFSEAVELALQEGALTDHKPNVVEGDTYRVMHTLQEIRFAWSQQISWFRVFVANRMGAFGDPEVSMQRNLVNRSMFAHTVQELLNKLKVYEDKELLGLQQSESLRVMEQASQEYERFLAEAVDIYLSENWRSDIPILRDKIQPNLTVSRYYVSLLEERFKNFSENSLVKSQWTSATLSKFIWLFVGTIGFLIWAGYLIYIKSIRTPLQQMTSAMEAEAKGELFVPVQYSNAEEILQLQRAFDGMRSQVHSRQTRLQSILDNAAEGIITIDENSNIESINNAAQKLFGYTAEEVVGKNISIFMTDDIKQQHDDLVGKYHEYDMMGRSREVRALRKDGLVFPMSLKISEFMLDNKKLFTAMVDDVSEHHAAMETLRHMAEHDSLTGLHNRQYFLDELDRSIEQAKRSAVYDYACLYIDLDNFKYINDTLGHLAGDRLLIEIASIFAKRIRKSDLLARLGGDEFAIILSNVDALQAEKTAEYYREKIASYTFKHKGKAVDVGCSIGMAMLDDEIEDKEDIMARADIACHMAKRAGRNRIHVYVDEDQKNMNILYNDMGWSRLIKTAIENDQFTFEYQPVVYTASQDTYCYEVLLRMIDPNTGEKLLPGVFMNAAERFGLMVEVDCWVIRKAMGELADLQKQHKDLRFSINLSAKSLTESIILQTIEENIHRYNLQPGSVTFEITEDVAISDIGTAFEFIGKLKALGCRTALDDFGVGYSSFSYLKELPVDIVKIDGSFVRNMENEKLNYALVKSMNDICHTLGKQTVAEFVENESVLCKLQEIGVDFVQGYHTGKPSPHLESTATSPRQITTAASMKKNPNLH